MTAPLLDVQLLTSLFLTTHEGWNTASHTFTPPQRYSLLQLKKESQSSGSRSQFPMPETQRRKQRQRDASEKPC